MEIEKDRNPLVDEAESSLYLLRPSDFAKNSLYYAIAIGKFLCNTNYITVRNSNEFNSFLLMCVVEGKLRITSKNTTVDVEKNEIILLDCYEAHSYSACEKTKFFYIHFDGNNSRHFYNAIQKASALKIKSPYFNEYTDFINEQISMLNRNEDLQEKTFSIFIHKLLCDLTEDQCKHYVVKYNDMVSNALRIIEYQYNDFSLSVSKIAKILCVSQQHLARLFKSDIGHSIYQHILLFRLNVACALLKNTDYTIEAISEMIGFSSTSNFMLKFKKTFNTTPTKHRKLHGDPESTNLP